MQKMLPKAKIEIGIPEVKECIECIGNTAYEVCNNKLPSLNYYSSSSELESELSPVEDGNDGRVGGGGKVSFSVSSDREVGSIALRSRSDLTSLEYFSVFSSLVRATIVDMFCIFGSVNVLASWIVPAVLFKIMPSGNDDSFISEPFIRS